jgi:hypothetical protein
LSRCSGFSLGGRISSPFGRPAPPWFSCSSASFNAGSNFAASSSRSPEQVEALVTRPIETAVNGLGDMESLRSESIEGLSISTAVFKEGTDVFRARLPRTG